jgi:DNA-directed RNA polymerase specialized sigma24 family protein
MGKEAARKIPEERAATPDEVHAAIDALTPMDWYRLRRFAGYYIFLLGEKAGDRRADDLLSEAFTRFLERTRKWDKTKVDFMGLLFGAIESISDSWNRKKSTPTDSPILASSLIVEDEDGVPSDPAEGFQSPSVSAPQMLVYKQTLEKIDALFADDPEVQMVLEAFRDGYDPPGVRELWGFTQKHYNAIVVRMRRNIDKAGITEPTKGPHHVQ